MKVFAWRTQVQLILLAPALLLLWWSLRAIQFGDLWRIFQRLTPLNSTLLVLANLVVLSALNGRWWLFLHGAGYTVPFWRLLSYRIAAFAVSYFTPGPHVGGEPLQVYLVSKRHEVPLTVAIAAVTLDKLLEMAVNLLVLGAGLSFIVQQQILANGVAQRALYLAFGLALLPLPLLIALYYNRHALAGWLTPRHERGAHPAHPPTRLERCLQTIEQSAAQILALWRSAPAIFGVACLISVLSWGALVGEFWYMTHVLGFGLSLSGAVTLLLAMRVAILLPMPAGLGALEAGLALTTAALGLSPAAGIGLSLLIRLRDVVLGLVGLWLGGFALWRQPGWATPAPTAPSAPAQQPRGLIQNWSPEDIVG